MTLLLLAILFPVMFRLVYGLVGFDVGKLHSKKWLWVVGGIAVLMVSFAGAMFLFADNAAINVSKSMANGNVEVLIGTLKGIYEVAEYDVINGGPLAVSYEATVSEGTVLLLVEKGSEVLFEENIPDSVKEKSSFRLKQVLMILLLLRKRQKMCT